MKRIKINYYLFLIFFFFGTVNAQTSKQGSVSIDFSISNGKIKALNSINNGTVNYATGVVMTDYMTQAWADLRFPYSRLHDCHWPYSDVVDIPAIFPLFHLDADDPKNYNFEKTDNYLLELLKSGSQPYYRLGVSIEHQKIKYFTHPPADFDKWAKICLNIIRHYNNGWADGYHMNIKYWEVWNEPDLTVMWGKGTPEQYYSLYEKTAKVIKKYNPELMVGTAGLCFYNLDFASNMLKHCKTTNTPIDFFCWHVYTADPDWVTSQALTVRKLLDENGFKKTESHLNEWNYWPFDFSRINKEREYSRYVYSEMGGPKGAAFITTVITNLQDAYVDQLFFYGGYIGAFGMFDDYGMPKKQFYALKAFAMMPTNRITCSKDTILKDVSILAGINDSKDEAVILISNFDSKTDSAEIELSNIPWKSATQKEVFVINDENSLNLIKRIKMEGNTLVFKEKISSPSVVVIRLTPTLIK